MNNKPFDPRSMEKLTSDLTRHLNEQQFDSEEDMKRYLEEMIGKPIPESIPQSAASIAQDVAYQAMDTPDKKKRIKLARQALELWPDCADAYNILAEEADTWQEMKEFYEKGVTAGKRAIGKEAFIKDKGYFWGIMKTRPYMRARTGLMTCLWSLGKLDQAIQHCREMLELNPGDNQGLRYMLINYLTEVKRFDELETFMQTKEYRNDGSAAWIYTESLLYYAKDGDCEKARNLLKEAIKNNKYVPEYIIGRKRMPDYLPDSFSIGSEDEAILYADSAKKAWGKTPGAVNWLKQQAGITTTNGEAKQKTGRNDPCPCGSGKKYKKCCG